MKIALLSVTERGRLLTERIQSGCAFACRRFCHIRHTDADAVSFGQIAEITELLFPRYDALVYCCAAGIAVRSAAPLLVSKETDPAVLVIDENGKFVIPVLSGHIGGGNALAQVLAAQLGAVPVITTATDSGGQFSPDSFAMANDLSIGDLSAAKAAAAAVLDGIPVGLRCDYPYRNLPPALHEGTDCEIGICISDHPKDKPFPVTLHLLPRDLVIGIGCRRGASAEQIGNCLVSSGIPLERVGYAATIDRKADEPGLLALCRAHRWRLVTFSAGALAAAEGDFAASDFVQETVGVDNVCERAAVLAAGGALVFRKYARDGVTCAAARRAVLLDFAKERDFS